MMATNFKVSGSSLIGPLAFFKVNLVSRYEIRSQKVVKKLNE